MITLYHYASQKKYEKLCREGFVKPTSPFNPRIRDEDWGKYIKRFGFPVSKYYTCTFLEPKPKAWAEYGLFDLLMEEFASGDYLLKMMVADNPSNPIIVREHKHHSPKEYGFPPEIWRRREIRDSRPDLREKWCNSAIPLSRYSNNYICPEFLIPYCVPLEQVIVEQQ